MFVTQRYLTSGCTRRRIVVSVESWRANSGRQINLLSTTGSGTILRYSHDNWFVSDEEEPLCRCLSTMRADEGISTIDWRLQTPRNSDPKSFVNKLTSTTLFNTIHYDAIKQNNYPSAFDETKCLIWTCLVDFPHSIRRCVVGVWFLMMKLSTWLWRLNENWHLKLICR